MMFHCSHDDWQVTGWKRQTECKYWATIKILIEFNHQQEKYGRFWFIFGKKNLLCFYRKYGVSNAVSLANLLKEVKVIDRKIAYFHNKRCKWSMSSSRKKKDKKNNHKSNCRLCKTYIPKVGFLTGWMFLSSNLFVYIPTVHFFSINLL